jgi:hypothetical protein
MRFDEAKHPRGVHGRFGGGSAVANFTRKRADRSYGSEERAVGRRGGGALAPRRTESAARKRWSGIVDRAHEVHGAYHSLASGRRLSGHDSGIVEYASPGKRAEARARTGGVVMPQREAMRRYTGLARRGGTPRASTKRTFGGKTVAVRGFGPEYTNAAGYLQTSARVRNLAGKRPGG